MDRPLLYHQLVKLFFLSYIDTLKKAIIYYFIFSISRELLDIYVKMKNVLPGLLFG